MYPSHPYSFLAITPGGLRGWGQDGSCLREANLKMNTFTLIFVGVLGFVVVYVGMTDAREIGVQSGCSIMWGNYPMQVSCNLPGVLVMTTGLLIILVSNTAILNKALGNRKGDRRFASLNPRFSREEAPPTKPFCQLAKPVLRQNSLVLFVSRWNGMPGPL